MSQNMNTKENNKKKSVEEDPVEKKIGDAFKLIIDNAREEDYEQCSAVALDFLKDYTDPKAKLYLRFKRFLKDPFGKNNKDYPTAKPYLPYAHYFKLFSEAYRNWQISYDYSPIRSRFGLAYHALKRGLEENEHKSDEDSILLKGFEQLSKMLCAYTRCENSFINNDPFALEKNAKEALKYENEVLRNSPELTALSRRKIKEKPPIERCQIEMAKWLRNYMRTNQLLHEGLKVCAETYKILLEEQRPLTEDEKKKLRDNIKDDTLEKLRKRSPELSSELNAHICHINSHNERLTKLKKLEDTEQKNTFLRINKGFLVVQMSAAFDADSSRDLFRKSEMGEKFRGKIEEGFGNLEVEATGYKINQLHDVFQTSFGESSLKTMSFDLWKKYSQVANGEDSKETNKENSQVADENKENFQDINKKDSEENKEIKIEVLNKEYDFDIRFSVSALGVCTLYFRLNIDNLKDKTLRNKQGLRVEEARVLQSLLSPHAGQVKITDKLVNTENFDKFNLNKFRFMQRIEFAELSNYVSDLCAELKTKNPKFDICEGEPSYKPLEKAVKRLSDALNSLVKEWLKKSKSEETQIFDTNVDESKNHEADDDLDENTKFVKDALENFIKLNSIELDSTTDEFKEIRKKISALDTHHRLAQLAEQYFSVIEKALADTLNENPSILKLSWEKIKTKLGWSKKFIENAVALKPATDTGWFTYLYCREIDEVSITDNKTKVGAYAGFDKIANHPDMMGFIVEQREARASFDDWRFIKPIEELEKKNLAHIRSHLTDGFFCTEYQAFIYFPDDPMFLTDQYEATVKLMVRLSTVLKYISGKAQKLSENIHEGLHKRGRNISTRKLDEDLREIRRLRLHANELQTLVARAAISRYKDHGDLMKRILSEMKLDQLVALLDQQLQHLSELYDDALRKLDEKRESIRSSLILLLTAAVGLSALHDFADSVFDVQRLKKDIESFIVFIGSQLGFTEYELTKDNTAESIFALTLMSFAFMFLIFIFFKWRRNH